jgi:hypothetical protein
MAPKRQGGADAGKARKKSLGHAAAKKTAKKTAKGKDAKKTAKGNAMSIKKGKDAKKTAKGNATSTKKGNDAGDLFLASSDEEGAAAAAKPQTRTFEARLEVRPCVFLASLLAGCSCARCRAFGCASCPALVAGHSTV